MFDIDRWQEIYAALKSNKLRTFLTAFGVFWGIFMLIIMLGSGKGLENSVFEDMGDFATNTAFIWARRTTIPYEGYPRGRRYNFTNDDMKALKDNISEIDVLAPRLQGWGAGDGENNVTRGLKTGAFTIQGDYPEMNKIDPNKIVNGRFINYKDIEQSRKVCVIGSRVKEVLFEENEEPIGKYIRIKGVYFQVVGLIEPVSNINFGGEKEQTIFLPFTALQKAYNFGNEVHYFSVTAKENVPVSVVDEKCKAIIRERHHIHPDDKQAVGGFNLEEEFAKMKGLFTGISVLIWIVGTGTLMAGVIGVSNIMLIIVKERTKEIGVQRAIGATPYKIISQIILESVVLTALAGYIGLVIGVGLIELINYLLVSSGSEGDFFRHPSVDFNVAISALIILIISGALAGLIPAQRAIRIKPIDALRDE
ncbi:MAG: ABC transporter permease [Bacteroidales bacterium]|nr:ABC transporter permease [Bacteroidales bacterium]MBN2758070.1 ABC transporter permease [Bacteroidales bacterium]